MTMTTETTTELILIRHAPALSEGRLAGRRDVSADCSDAAGFAALRAAIGVVDHIVVSPALRCQQTLAHLWPDAAGTTDARLWEQDFGDWEDQPFDTLPDLGVLTPQALAEHRPPKGESFLDLCARVQPALLQAAELGGKVAVVAHAGVVRAGLSLALGAPASGLAFQVAPLSMSVIVALPQKAWSVAGVNRIAL